MLKQDAVDGAVDGVCVCGISMTSNVGTNGKGGSLEPQIRFQEAHTLKHATSVDFSSLPPQTER